MKLAISVTQLYGLILAFSFTIISPSYIASLLPQEADGQQVHLDQFDMLTESSGWVLFDQQLFWTSNAGQTWAEIGPTMPHDVAVEDVQFIDSKLGWILATVPNPDGGAFFQLFETNDGGITWATRALSLFDSGEIASYVEKAEMEWLDPQTGWISVKQTSGSNFSIGTLFTTSDSGNSWRRLSIPVADDIYFSDPYTGWAVGGPANDQIFKTQDAGTTWRNVRPADIPADTQTVIYPPAISSGHDLLVMTHTGVKNSLKVYTLPPSSDEWLGFDQVQVDVQPGIIGLSILDTQNFVAVIPGTKSIVRMKDDKLYQLENIDGSSSSIVELDMVSLDVGWAKSVQASCISASLSDGKTAPVSCSSTIHLLQTINGGVTWQNIELPMVQANRASLDTPGIITNSTTLTSTLSSENTITFVGQGFDRCEIPSLSQMQTWSDNSPYKSVNLYIGGSNRACDNTALSSAYLFQLYQQGWKFFPTWVGPQAPCTGYSSRISSNTTTAYEQGVNQANLAVERLAELGLVGPAKTGSVVYYDMEHYGTNAACRSAVNAFMNGWVSQIHSRGNLAGVYGSTLCNTGLSDFLNITNVPDVIWPARWYHNLGSGYYDPNASVWNLGSCIPNTAWSNHQRIRQYEGDHNETWGSLTLDIDSDVLDGVVAVPYQYPFVTSIIAMNSNPTNATGVGFQINFSKPVTGVNQSDFALITTGGISGVSITNLTGSGGTYIVTVNTGSGNGAIRLDVVDNNTISDSAGNLLGGIHVGDGNFISGETYTVLKASQFLGADFTGDGKTDVAVFRPSNSTWHIQDVGSYLHGQTGDVPVPADYDGDGKDDIAVFRPSNSTWYVLGQDAHIYGAVGDIPVVADYDGDGKDDIAVFRPTTSTWYIYGVGSFVYGTVGDIPVVADYNGDGKADIAVFRPTNSTWYIRRIGPRVYGTVGDIPVVADYNGDGKADIAVFRPTNSTWYLYGVGPRVYGMMGDLPVVGDYDGDGKADVAVFRPTNNTWYIYGVGPSIYGTVGDIPV